jgi:hypothetical protein
VTSAKAVAKGLTEFFVAGKTCRPGEPHHRCRLHPRITGNAAHRSQRNVIGSIQNESRGAPKFGAQAGKNVGHPLNESRKLHDQHFFVAYAMSDGRQRTCPLATDKTNEPGVT